MKQGFKRKQIQEQPTGGEMYMLAQIREMSQKQLYNNTRSIKFKEAYELAIEHVVSNYKPTTQKAFLQRANVVLPIFRHFLLQQITLEMVYDFLKKQKEKGAQNGTLNKYVFFFKTVFNFAYKMRFIQENITRDLRKYKEPPSRNRVLTPEEEDRLLFVVPPWLRDMIILALQTGMRSSEISLLTWDCVDLKRRIVRLKDSKNGKQRVIPLTETATKMFQDRYEGLPGLIFRNPYTGKDYSVYPNFKRYVTRLKLQNLCFHDLRHTAVTRMITNEISVSAVMSIVGHSSETMTQRYTHLSNEYLGNLFHEIKKL